MVKTPDQEPGLRPESLRALEQFQNNWSAITVRTPEGPVIVNNPRHTYGRRNNNITHELAHLVLDHAPGSLQTIFGCVLRDFDEEQESEAALLGEALLVPRVSLEWAAIQQMDVAKTADWLGASERLVRSRIDRTGVKRQYPGYLAV